MNRMGLKVGAVMGVVGMALLSAAAGAQCLSGAWRGGASNGPTNNHQAVSGARLISAAYRPDRDDDDQGSGRASIVGMWHVHLVAQSTVNLPNLTGVEVDAGYQQWHSDNTELLNSGGRGPATSSFCMGVWEQVGPRRYRLNHFAISWTQGPAPNANSGPTNIRTGPGSIVEDVTVSPNGKTFTGTFTITEYTETDSPNGSSLSFADSITGTISATRIDVNTPVSPIF